MGREIPILPEGWPHTRAGREPTCQPTRRIWWSDARRARFEQMWREGVDVEEMADFFETDPKTIYGKAGQWKLGRRTPRGVNGGNPGWPEDKRQRFRDMWNSDAPVPDIAAAMKTSRGAVYQRAQGDEKCKKRRPGPSGAAGHRRKAVDRTGQRRFPGIVHPEGYQPKIVLEPHHPAHRLGTTVFPSSVIPASRLVRLLKSGENSRKIGKRVEKGRWRGFPIFTLTLVERETCPRTCLEWASCYGNNMHLAHRILDDGTLTRRLWAELASLNAEHPNGYLVRLHVLGDFFSRDYVRFWAEALGDFPALHVFGFTARRPNDPIGADLVYLVAEKGERFHLRFSGAGYETHSAEVVDRAAEATGILCPAQRDEKRSCATCGLCWTSDRTISFLRH